MSTRPTDGRFDVLEIEIRNPINRRVMVEDLSKKDAEAFIYIAIARRGVKTHFYTTQPHLSPASKGGATAPEPKS